MQVFAQRLRERARELGLSDAEVARRAGLSERRYGHYAAGAREPDLGTLLRICETLAVTPNDLLLPRAATPRRPSRRERLLGRLDAVVRNVSAEDLELAVCQVECLSRHRRKERQLLR